MGVPGALALFCLLEDDMCASIGPSHTRRMCCDRSRDSLAASCALDDDDEAAVDEAVCAGVNFESAALADAEVDKAPACTAADGAGQRMGFGRLLAESFLGATPR